MLHIGNVLPGFAKILLTLIYRTSQQFGQNIMTPC